MGRFKEQTIADAAGALDEMESIRRDLARRVDRWRYYDEPLTLEDACEMLRRVDSLGLALHRTVGGEEWG